MTVEITLTAISSAAVIGHTSDGYGIRIDLTADDRGLVPLSVSGPGMGFTEDRRAPNYNVALAQARDIITGRRRLVAFEKGEAA